MQILHVVGARPNFMKAAPVLRALSSHSGVRQTLVHTGQHYDAAMSDVFFQQLEMPQPDRNLGVGSGTHAQQTAAVMVALEPVLLELKPDLVLLDLVMKKIRCIDGVDKTVTNLILEDA